MPQELPQRWITDWEPSTRWPHYTRANAGEVLPHPASPLTATYVWDHAMVPGWREGYVRQGFFATGELNDHRPDVVGFFAGYLYVNLAATRMLAVRNPALTVEALDAAFFGDNPDVPPYVAHPRDSAPELEGKIMEHLAWVTGDNPFPELDEARLEVDAIVAGRPSLEGSSVPDLLARAAMLQPAIARVYEQHVVNSSGSAIAPGIFAALGEALSDPDLAMDLLASIGDVDSAEIPIRVWSLAREVVASPVLTAAFDRDPDAAPATLASSDDPAARQFTAAWREFLADFGSRGGDEWELRAPGWETDPHTALAAIERLRHQPADADPSQRRADRAAQREATIASVRSRLAYQPELLALFESGVNATRLIAWRERSKFTMIKLVHEARMVFRELARRAAHHGDIDEELQFFQLLDDEVGPFFDDPTGWSLTLAERDRVWHELHTLVPPFIIVDANVPPLPQWERRAVSTGAPALATGGVLHGVSGSGGSVIGVARIIRDPGEATDLEPGDILVASATDPSWTPLFLAAAGVVVETGGQISHAIIVSRELGIPCVVSVEGATGALRDGMRIEVDGTAGTVTALA